LENILKALKKAEDEAAAISREATERASALVRGAEDAARELEAESEREAKAAGDRLLEERMDSARKEAERIKARAEEAGSDLDRRVKKNFEVCVDEVVKSIAQRMKAPV